MIWSGHNFCKIQLYIQAYNWTLLVTLCTLVYKQGKMNGKIKKIKNFFFYFWAAVANIKNWKMFSTLWWQQNNQKHVQRICSQVWLPEFNIFNENLKNQKKKKKPKKNVKQQLFLRQFAFETLFISKMSNYWLNLNLKKIYKTKNHK